MSVKGHVGRFLSRFKYIIVIIICSFVLAKTVYGRRVYACGGNLQAAKVAGINTTAIRISTFAIAGFLAGLCGFLMTSRVTIGQPTTGDQTVIAKLK